jgi:hypothetical protein
MAAIVAASSGSLWAAHSKLGSDSSPCVNERARGRRTAMRWPPSTTWLAVVPPRTARRWALGIGHARGAAQRDPVGLHQGCQHLLARIDAQAQEGVAHIAQNALHGQRDLHLGSWQCPQRGLHARLHFGGSFLCLQGTWMLASRRKEPPTSSHPFNRVRDIAPPQGS